MATANTTVSGSGGGFSNNSPGGANDVYKGLAIAVAVVVTLFACIGLLYIYRKNRPLKGRDREHDVLPY